MDRREVLAAGLAALVPIAFSPGPVWAQLLLAHRPSDDRRAIVHPAAVLADAVPRLELVPVRNGWGGPPVGRVLRYAVRGGWLCAEVELDAPEAADLAAGRCVLVPSLFEEFADGRGTGADTDHLRGRIVSRIKGIDEIAVFGPADALWPTLRTPPLPPVEEQLNPGPVPLTKAVAETQSEAPRDAI